MTTAMQYSRAIEGATNYMRWIVEGFGPYIGRSVVEIGVGHGAYRRQLPSHVDRYVGLDVHPGLVERARALYPEARFLQGDLMDPTTVGEVAKERCDTVLCVNVLEHIEDDRRAAAHLLSMLVAGGHLLLFVPAHPTLYTDLDRLAGHHRRYTRDGLAELFPADIGTVRRLEYFNPIGGLGWWVNGLFPHRSLDSRVVNGQLGLFDKYILPASRVANRLTRSFFGQSLLCVVQKK
jgi:SAM-dependent methyltransferase